MIYAKTFQVMTGRVATMEDNDMVADCLAVLEDLAGIKVDVEAFFHRMYRDVDKDKDEFLILQRLKHVEFLCRVTSPYARKHRGLMTFHKTFATKDTFVSINDSLKARIKTFPFIFYTAILLMFLCPFNLPTSAL